MSKKHILSLFLGLIIIISIFLIYKSGELERIYKSEVTRALSQKDITPDTIITENDIKDLPQPVQKYLKYVGVVGKPKVKNFKYVGEGDFKTGPDKGWVKASAEQYSFIENPRRLYYMKLNMFGLPVVGLHNYNNATATMKIKLAGLITVADAKGDIMNKAETVTIFNDMCLMAPASLIDKRITWETISPLKVKGTFNNNGIKISAELYFNDKGELINFISNDRYMTTSGNNYQNAPWSTPVKDYKDYNGVKLASYGEAHWALPEGDYCYGKLTVKEIKYNIDDSKEIK